MWSFPIPFLLRVLAQTPGLSDLLHEHRQNARALGHDRRTRRVAATVIRSLARNPWHTSWPGQALWDTLAYGATEGQVYSRSHFFRGTGPAELTPLAPHPDDKRSRHRIRPASQSRILSQ